MCCDMQIVNECSDARYNDCSPHARCIDKTVGYTCRCVPGFADVSPEGLKRPGRQCIPCKSFTRRELSYSESKIYQDNGERFYLLAQNI
ncbi:unnamed protein product [Strongylus vulgaris]|uniref:EGF-like domain-containing protein n=1 Tax=Strongylus vulgaris TaxID=40348 RepID=A0A3P7IJE0_STRVU|nr:unnamed protein product [Strongylus vulgaris]